MNLKFLTRAVVGSSLRLIRLPLDGFLLVGGGSTSAARPFVDRADAAIRGTAGLLLRDDVLIEDAERRRAAADEREHALRLRAEADYRSDRGERKATAETQEADARRREAERAAQEKRDTAQKRRDAAKSRAAAAARGRKQAAQRRVKDREQVIAERTRRDRLEATDKASEALEEKAVALATADEARRLKKVASAAKSTRKSGPGN